MARAAAIRAAEARHAVEARREFDIGELRQRSRVALPFLAGLGGMMGALLREAFHYRVGVPSPAGESSSSWMVDQPRVTYAVGDAEGPLSVLEADALLGLPFLLRFAVVTFDYPRERLILTPREEGSAE